MARPAAMGIFRSNPRSRAIAPTATLQPRRLLIIGFDLWTGNMYRALRHVNFDDLEIEVFALPGHHYNYLYPFLPDLLAEFQPNVVLFDLLSTPCRGWATGAHLADHFHAMLQLSAAHGAKAGLVHFYDAEEIEVDSDPLAHALNASAEELGLPILDLPGWWRDAGHASVLPLEGERVKISDAVAISQKIVSFARSVCSSEQDLQFLSNLGVADHVRQLAVVDASRMVPAGAATESRAFSGLSSDALVVEEGESVTLQIPEGAVINGIYFIHGPRSGDFEITSDRGLLMIQRCYDAWSYYERPVVMNLDSQGARAISIRQLSGIPDLELVQGQVDRSPRVGKIGPIMMYKSG